MAAFKKIIQCPSCRFANRLGDARCIICKHDLPQTEAEANSPAATAKPSPAAGPAKPPARAPSAVAPKAPPKPAPPGASPAPKDDLNPASTAAAQARIAAAKQQPRPAKRDAVTSVQKRFVDASLLAASGGAAPPKPLTTKVVKGAADDAVAWLWCDPLPPIPLGLSREVTVGRHEKCDLVLPHKEVSRHHASFKVAGKQITLEDQGSSNGCYVNGKRLSREIVRVGDKIQVGPYELELRERGSDGGKGDDGADTKRFDLTSLGSSGHAASMAGKLSEVSLVEILQGIEFNKKTCTLAISDGRMRGQIVFSRGRPQAASFGPDRDVPAVRAMLRLREGRFVLSADVDATEATMKTTVTALLLDHSRELDEAGRPLLETDEGQGGEAGETTERLDPRTLAEARGEPLPEEEPAPDAEPPGETSETGETTVEEASGEPPAEDDPLALFGAGEDSPPDEAVAGEEPADVTGEPGDAPQEGSEAPQNGAGEGEDASPESGEG